MKVLNVVTSVSNGVGTFLLNKGGELSKMEISYDVLSLNPISDNFNEKIGNWGGKVTVLSLEKHLEEVAPDVQWGCRFDDLLKKESYGAIFWHMPSFLLQRAQLIASKQQIPFYIHIHTDPLPAETNPLLIEVFRREAQDLRQLTRAYVGCSERSVRNAYQLPPEYPVTVLTNSIDWSRVSQLLTNREQLRQDLRAAYRYRSDDLVIGFAGRLSREKNIYFILELAKRTRTILPNAQFILFGDGPERDQLRAKITELGLSHVRLVGEVQDMLAQYLALDRVILPSRSEGLPMTIVEAQAMGVPSIVSNTVTPEVDLGVNLVQFAPLDEVETWLGLLEKWPSSKQLNVEERYSVFYQSGYTNDSSAERYRQFLKVQNLL